MYIFSMACRFWRKFPKVFKMMSIRYLSDFVHSVIRPVGKQTNLLETVEVMGPCKEEMRHSSGIKKTTLVKNLKMARCWMRSFTLILEYCYCIVEMHNIFIQALLLTASSFFSGIRGARLRGLCLWSRRLQEKGRDARGESFSRQRASRREF